MKKLTVLTLAIVFIWGCSGSLDDPVGITGQGNDNPLGLPSIDNPGTIQIVDYGVKHATDEDLARVIEKQGIDPAALELEGGLCPVLIDCWWVDEQEFNEDWLWENYCWPIDQSMVFVWMAKLPDMNEPCPIMPVDIWGWLAFTQCEEGKPRPQLHSNIIEVPWGSMEYYKGIWFFYVTITVTGMPPGYHDAIFVNSWDGPDLLPFDDACGIDFWESADGGFPPNLFMVFNPEPPFPPGGWPPCRLDGEDGETRPWCVGVDRWNTTSATWDIFLWDSACNLLASASVTGGSGWYFADITPVPIAAGDQFYVGYEVDEAAGSYLYRDTTSPVDLGYLTVDYASYNTVGNCPDLLNGYLVSPVDVEIFVPLGTVVEPPMIRDHVLNTNTPVATDALYR